MLDRSLNSAAPLLMPRPDGAPTQWAVSPGPVTYPDAVATMTARVRKAIGSLIMIGITLFKDWTQ